MDLNLIRIFVAVYGNGSYTQAARALNISQPAVSQAIKRLEDSVGMPLFIRQGRGITPTAKAVSMAEPLETAMNLINGAFSSERRLLGYGVEAVLHSIGKLDGIKFVLPPSDQSQALDDLRTNKVELMVDNVMTEDLLRIRALSEQPIVVVCREQHPRLTTETMTREAFYNEEHVVLKTRRGGSNY
ncbi:transcriptional regulator LysR family [Vibrio astriarenae]|nr:transcriptional regulator LysR family [Vibrio sp. C7]